ncbi:MAG: sulfatase [bacterium]|nr:sulfatase [bacterium]
MSSAQQEEDAMPSRKPNLVFVFGDQWRAQSIGYRGDTNALTPNLDRLESESVNFTNAVSGCPVCTPYRASLMTGQYWLTHGAFMNDVHLRDEAVSLAEAYNAAGYDTGYIGKWHIDGHGRGAFIPRERRQGWQYWKVLECTHNYNDSPYYGDENRKLTWEGYDAIAQTRDAQQYIRDHAKSDPFALCLSWGPPHAPYHTAPKEFQALIDPEKVTIPPNVPAEHVDKARKFLAGYYAHIAALDACIGDLLTTLDECGIADNTVFVFTSDHGDMLLSHGFQKKQQPYEESIRVPFLVRYPDKFGKKGRRVATMLNTPDIMPTVLGLCDVPIPDGVEGEDFSRALERGKEPDADAALLMCPAPFGQWSRDRGGRAYRGVRTARYTYTRDLNGPWLLFDNETDPYQMTNLCGKPEMAKVQAKLDKALNRLLKQTNDEFKPTEYYVEKWGYPLDKTGTVPYKN